MTILTITVKPNAKASNWVDTNPQQLSLRLKARPQEGEANAECLRFLATFFNVPKSSLTLISGETSRLKRIDIPLSSEQIDSVLSKT